MVCKFTLERQVYSMIQNDQTQFGHKTEFDVSDDGKSLMHFFFICCKHLQCTKNSFSHASLNCKIAVNRDGAVVRASAFHQWPNLTAAWLAQLVERQSAVREVEGSSPRSDQHSGSKNN